MRLAALHVGGMSVVVALAVACASRSGTPVPRVITATTDAEVIDAVVEDLAGRGAEWLFSGDPTGHLVRVLATTPGSSLLISEMQLRSDLSEMDWDALVPLAVSLRSRGELGEAAIGKLHSEHARVSPVESREGAPGRHVPVREDEIGFIRPWLPGFAEDGSRALVRFLMGPSPHGACGTYLLVWTGEKWAVKWRDFAFYA